MNVIGQVLLSYSMQGQLHIVLVILYQQNLDLSVSHTFSPASAVKSFDCAAFNVCNREKNAASLLNADWRQMPATMRLSDASREQTGSGAFPVQFPGLPSQTPET
jgi:hypothetical protein